MKGMAYHGWKHGLPDKFWPVTLDNFFDNPDEIRELGVRSLEPDEVITSSDQDGRWPGLRSQMLSNIDEGLAQRIIDKILGCYFNLDFEQVFWNSFDIQFHSIPSIDKDKNNTKNKGWIHRDGINPRYAHHPTQASPMPNPIELAGLIYLTPDIERDTGTSLFNMKKDKILKDWNETAKIKRKIYLGDPINDEEAKEKWEIHRSCFIEKVRFENIYNRLIMYDGMEWHAANSFYTAKDNRLTLVFFVRGILPNKWPLQRVRKV